MKNKTTKRKKTVRGVEGVETQDSRDSVGIGKPRSHVAAVREDTGVHRLK